MSESTSLPAPPVVASVGAGQIAGWLRQLGYDEISCSRRLGLAHPRLIASRTLSAGVPRPLMPRGIDDALEVLVAILLRGEEASLGDLTSALPRPLLNALFDACILVEGNNSDHHQSIGPLFPSAGQFVLTDWAPTKSSGDPVMPLFHSSYDLASILPRRRIARALDLCTGSGIYALTTASHATTATAVDISERALRFAACNAWINGVHNIHFVRSSLYDTIAHGMAYDLITADPPHSATPFPSGQPNFWSGGPDGDAVIRPTVAGVPEHLAQDGIALLHVLLMGRSGNDTLASITESLGPSMDIAFAWEDASERLSNALIGTGRASEGMSERERGRLETFMRRHYERRDIRKVELGVLAVRHARPGRSGLRIRTPYETVLRAGDSFTEIIWHEPEASAGSAL